MGLKSSLGETAVPLAEALYAQGRLDEADETLKAVKEEWASGDASVDAPRLAVRASCSRPRAGRGSRTRPPSARCDSCGDRLAVPAGGRAARARRGGAAGRRGRRGGRERRGGRAHRGGEGLRRGRRVPGARRHRRDGPADRNTWTCRCATSWARWPRPNRCREPVTAPRSPCRWLPAWWRWPPAHRGASGPKPEAPPHRPRPCGSGSRRWPSATSRPTPGGRTAGRSGGRRGRARQGRDVHGNLGDLERNARGPGERVAQGLVSCGLRSAQQCDRLAVGVEVAFGQRRDAFTQGRCLSGCASALTPVGTGGPGCHRHQAGGHRQRDRDAVAGTRHRFLRGHLLQQVAERQAPVFAVRRGRHACAVSIRARADPTA